MAIEINSLSSNNLQNVGDNAGVQRTQVNPGMARAATGRTLTKSDSFKMTHSASQLQELEARIAAMPVVDAQKIDAVQRALSTGSFTIDPQSAADKMLTMEIALP